MRSRNGGESWQEILPHATRSIAFDSRQLGRIYIATDKGIERSDDNGHTWRPMNHGFSNRTLIPLSVSKRGAVYTGAAAGSADSVLFRLDTGAEEWTTITIPLPSNETLAAVAATTSGGRIYAATERSIVISSDEGVTWTRLILPASLRSLRQLFSWPPGPGRVLAVAGSDMFVSRDFASTWTPLTVSGEQEIAPIVAADLPWNVATADSRIFVSDGGETWKAWARIPDGATVHGIIQASGKVVLAATSAGLLMSPDDGASWRPAGAALGRNTTHAICRHPSRFSTLFAASHGAIYRSLDAGRSWSRMAGHGVPFRSVKQMVVVPGSPDRLLVLTSHEGVFMLPLDSATGVETSE
jgi:photosystem II stability/assembly factor-like uncharacterized protein